MGHVSFVPVALVMNVWQGHGYVALGLWAGLSGLVQLSACRAIAILMTGTLD